MLCSRCKRKMSCSKLRISFIVPLSLLAIIITFSCSVNAVTTDCAAISTPFKCGGSTDRCINSSRVCDGSNDCLDWSDEKNCGNQTCESYQFQCKEHNNCINGAWRCDGDEDCSDGSDEAGCPSRSCTEEQFRCSNGRCVPIIYRCDGENDCNDNSDEPDDCPPLTCRDYQFACESGDACISYNWECDGEEDCDDGSDERNCSTINVLPCNIGTFDCGPNSTYQRCIRYSWVCDGEEDCDNGADEAMCRPDNTTSLCNSGQFACLSGECLPALWQCDGDNDCADATDEADCEATCGPHQFHCEVAGQCIDGSLVCNGVSDCRDGTDEQLSSCADILQPTVSCAPDMFQCSDFSRCLTGNQHCDNRSHCADDSDEQNCSYSLQDECNRDNGGCAQICHDTPMSYFCSCRHGYKINPDRRSCDDIDECVYTTPCTQLCHNTDGGYSCSCIDGFISDGPYCINSSDGDAWLLYSDRLSLRRISTDNSHTNKVLIGELNYPISMDYHYQLGYVFWTDYAMKKIERAYLNGSGPITTIIDRGLEQPTGIAVDWVNNKIYWTDSYTKLIEVSELDGSNRLALVWSNMELPRPIVLDPFNRYMYWSDWGINARIERAQMDGSNRVVLHNTRLVWPNALAIDLTGERLYWADAKLHVIEVSHLDGSHRQVVAEQVQHPFSMTLFGQFLYYTDWQVGGVIRVSKLTGDSSNTTKVLVETDKITSMGIKAVHPSLQQQVSNPCQSDNGGCSHLCLLSATSLGHSSCACPTGYKIDRSKRNCLHLDKFILFTRSVDIRRISLDTPSLVDVTLPVTGLQYTIGLDWSGERNAFYWCDYLNGTVNVATLEGNNQRVLISGKDSQPVGLAVDWINDKLYWTDSNLDRIEVLDLNTSKRSVLVSTGLDKPRGIAVHPTKGLMFWTDWGYNAKIERANMDGSKRVTLIDTGLTWPNGITIDYEADRIYWVDADNSTRAIEYCDFNGNGRSVLINQRLLHPFGITLFKDHVYWTDWETNKLERADKLTGNNRIVVHANLGRLMDLTVVHSDRAIVSNPCAVNNGGCSYLCLLRPATDSDGVKPGCVCPNGISLLDDKKTCASRIHNYIMFSVFTELRKVSLDVPNPVDEHANISGRSISTITVDPVTEDIFFSDINQHKITRWSRSTGETRVIPRLGSTKSEGLAVDWLSQQVYWSDIDSKTIEVSDYEGSVRSLLLTRDDGLSGPRAIALDLKNRYLFFADWQTRSEGTYAVVIKRAAMDGSYLQTIVHSPLAGHPTDLAIDYQGDSTRLYWTKSEGSNGGLIVSTDIHGKNYTVLRNILNHAPNGLSVMLGRIFWSGWAYSRIHSADKLTGSDMKTEFDANGQSVSDIYVFSSNYTVATGDYPCHRGNHTCSHLCLPNTSNRGYRCACNTGTTVDGNTCNPAPHGFIIYAEVTVENGGDYIHGSLRRIPLGATSAYQTTLVSTIDNPVALEFYHTDDYSGYIYYSDPSNQYIGRVGFDGTGLATVVTNVQTDSLAVDWVSGNLYWIDYDVLLKDGSASHTNFTISVSRLDGSYRKTLISTGLSNLRGLAVLPREGKIFWNDYTPCNARIESANMDGSDKQVVIRLNENYTECDKACSGRYNCDRYRYTNQMELNYTSNELYWVDGNQDVLETVNINGSNHRVLQNLTYCFGLGLDISDVYVTSWLPVQGFYSLLKWHNSPSSTYQTVRDDIQGLPMDVAVVRRDKRPSGEDDLNACAVNNGGCKYLCLPVNHTHRRCACPDVLNERCIEYVGLPPTPDPTSVAMTTTPMVSSSGVVVMDTTITDDFIITPTLPTTSSSPSSTQSTGDDEEITGSLVAAYVVLAAMVMVLVIALVLIILCFVRRTFPDRCPPVQQGRRHSILAVYGRFRSRKLPEETSNGWNEKPNNFIDQLPTTKQLSAPLGGACVPSRVTHNSNKNTITKDSDTLFPKTVNVKAPMNVDPATPPSPLSPNDEAALVRIEQSKVVFETKI